VGEEDVEVEESCRSGRDGRPGTGSHLPAPAADARNGTGITDDAP
jgi:hypothetical protein